MSLIVQSITSFSLLTTLSPMSGAVDLGDNERGGLTGGWFTTLENLLSCWFTEKEHPYRIFPAFRTKTAQEIQAIGGFIIPVIDGPGGVIPDKLEVLVQKRPPIPILMGNDHDEYFSWRESWPLLIEEICHLGWGFGGARRGHVVVKRHTPRGKIAPMSWGRGGHVNLICNIRGGDHQTSKSQIGFWFCKLDHQANILTRKHLR